MKKIMFGLVFFLFARTICHAQNGLENIIVEKYYVSNAADAAGSVGTLPVGSVTYRIYADLLPGYNFQALYGVPGHTLSLQTSTTFFNNEDYGGTAPTISSTNVRKNSALLDSWFSVGGAANGKVGVIKSEDTDGSPGNAQGILQNNDPSASGPINIGTAVSMLAWDGMITGTPVAVTPVGFTTELDVFDGTSQVGGLFTTINGSIAALGGATGPTAANRVLVGQFTTDGVFCFELNVQIGTPTGGTQSFVASNPGAGEITIPSLTGCFGAPNLPPTVSITAPSNGAGFITGSPVAITATAGDTDGNVDSVAFYIDGIFLSKDISAPYTANYISVAGSHCITARATDNNGAQTTTACVNITVANNPPPSVNITSPSSGASFITGATVIIDATASDNGAVDSVAFYIDGVFLSKDISSPYNAVYTGTVGSHCITARATDNLGLQTTTACVNITLANNPPPSVSITSPANGTSFITGSSVAINATAADNGSVDSVAFYVDGLFISKDIAAPYIASYTAGALGSHCITARATDNNGAQTTTICTNINVVSTILPYKIVTTSSSCIPNTFCVPVAAVGAVSNVIGYDLVVGYNPAKVTPSGVISVYGDLINPAYVDAINSIDAANGLINISLFFNASAPASAQFQGTGNLICVEFTKTANFNTVDNVLFTIPSIQESYFTGVTTQFADNGNFSTYRDSIFNGSLKFWIDNSPIKYNPLNPVQHLVTNIYGNNSTCTNQSLVAVQPDTFGVFRHNILNGRNINIEKDILGTTDVMPVINGFDALLARKVLLNDLSFVPNVYQAIAMDVNLDEVISAGDVSQVNQRTVLMIPEFKQAWNYNAQGQSNGQPSKDWLFIDSVTLATNPAYVISATYPLNDGVGFSKARVPAVPFCLPITATTADCPVITPEWFQGVLIGDVNGNYSTTSPNSLFRQASDKIVFDLSKAVHNNGYMDVPVSIVATETVNSLDFSFKFNEQNMAFNTVVDLENDLQAMSNYNANDRTVRFTSNSLQNLETDKSLLSVRFATNGAQISETDFNSLTGYLNGERVNVEVLSRTAANSTGNVMVNVYPNPASELLNITVSEDAKVELLTIDGREVISETNVNADQKMEINTQSIANGVYMIKIYNNNFVSMKKVVIRK